MTTITITLLIILNIIFMIKFEYDKKERFLTVFTLNKSSSLINLKFKFPKRLNMKLSLIFFLFLFTLSCKKENTRYTVIPIKNFSQEIEMDRILSDILPKGLSHGQHIFQVCRTILVGRGSYGRKDNFDIVQT